MPKWKPTPGFLYQLYIHNWPLQHFSQDYGLAAHTTHVVCVNFIHKGRDLQFNVASQRQNFWETLSWQFYLHSQFLPEIYWEEIAKEIFLFFIFQVSHQTWGTNTQAFTSVKPTRYLLDHDDFIRKPIIVLKLSPKWAQKRSKNINPEAII